MKEQRRDRILAIDVMRGLTIALMILVNTPGSWAYVYPPFRHAEWHGCTPTDMVFPFFVFIVGMTLFLSSRKFSGGYSKNRMLKIIRRTALIFLIGLLLNWFPFYNKSIAELRILGVLQRIALAYGITAILTMFIKFRYTVLSLIVVLIGYWAILYYGADDPYSLEGNVVRRVDRLLLGDAHLWKGKGIPFDPEGLLSTLGAVGTVLLGYISAHWVHHRTDHYSLVKRLLIFGFAILLIGYFWSYILPINKSLWTPSYVMYVGGMAMIFLGLLIFLLDIQNWKFWIKPFIHVGLNPLIIYALSGLLVKLMIYVFRWEGSGGTTNSYTALYKGFFAPIFGHMLGSFIFGLTMLLFLWAIAYFLYRKKVIIKV